MKLIIYEIKKILNINVIVILLLFYSINCYKISDMNKLSMYPQNIRTAYNNIYEYLKGELTEEKIDFINDEYGEILKNEDNKDKDSYYTGNSLGDSVVFGTLIIPEINYIRSYKSYSQDLIGYANDNCTFFHGKGKESEIYRNKTIINNYSNRKIDIYSQTTGFSKYFQYQFSSLLCLIIIVLISSRIFSLEIECGMKNLIMISKVGRGKITICKIGAVIFINILLVFSFTVFDMWLINKEYSMDFYNNPIWSVPFFKETPFNITILGMIFLNMLLKLLGLIMFTMTVLAIFSYTRNSLLNIIVGFIYILLLLFFDELKMCRLINPISLITNSTLLNSFAAVDFTTPLNMLCTYVIISLLWTGVCMWVVLNHTEEDY